MSDNEVKAVEKYRSEELAVMKENFYGNDQSYHIARHNFVLKIPTVATPRHLARHRHK